MRDATAAAVRCLLAVALLVGAFPAHAERSVRVVLLGTAGGPTPKRMRAAPAQAIEIGDAVYVVDCGNGVGRQMALAGVSLRNLRHVFVTHHHSDHVADLVALPLLAWAAGLDHEVTLHGPPPLRKAVRSGLRQFAYDIDTRRADEARPDLGRLLHVRELSRDGVVWEDERVTVRAARVEHPPIRDAYAYRFDTPELSVVISGDTAPSPALVRLARGADVLVHEVLLYSPEEVSRWIGKSAEHPLVRHIVQSHTSFRDIGRIAREADVKMLVLSHFVPGDIPVDRESVLAEIRKSFAGEVRFGEDLMQIP